jgi:hypothetical protein
MANEKRLIDANALYKEVTEKYHDITAGSYPFNIVAYDMAQMVKNAPTVDAVEVVHARWEDGYAVDDQGNITYHSIDCSHCQGVFKAKSRAEVEPWKEQFVRCPFCGAIMDGGNEDG